MGKGGGGGGTVTQTGPPQYTVVQPEQSPYLSMIEQMLANVSGWQINQQVPWLGQAPIDMFSNLAGSSGQTLGQTGIPTPQIAGRPPWGSNQGMFGGWGPPPVGGGGVFGPPPGSPGFGGPAGGGGGAGGMLPPRTGPVRSPRRDNLGMPGNAPPGFAPGFGELANPQSLVIPPSSPPVPRPGPLALGPPTPRKR